MPIRKLPDDIYQEGASIAFEVPLDQVMKWQRHAFKEQFYLFTYCRGMDEKTLKALIRSIAEGMRKTRASK
jgi:hypothetical protein